MVPANLVRIKTRGGSMGRWTRARRAVAIAVVLGSLAVPAAAFGSSLVVINGRGWGHGIGLSQWGAEGYARHGWGFEQVLAHYYPHTTIGSAPAQSVRVLLAEGESEIAIGSARPFLLVDSRGRTIHVRARSVRLTPGLRFRQARPCPADHRQGRRTAADARRRRLPRLIPGRACRGGARSREHDFRRAVSARGRPVRDARSLVAGGVQGSGHRRPFLRAGESPSRLDVRSLRRYAEPGLRRDPQRAAGDESRCRALHPARCSPTTTA